MAYFTLVTETGAAVIAAAIAAGQTVPIAQLCVGDGNGADHEPVGTETALVHQVWAGAVTGMSSDGDTLTVEAAIPHDVGGFTIREIGILDNHGALIAIGNYPETLKPAVSDGALVEILARMIVKFETDISGVIEITIDPGSVYATRNYADQAADDAVLEHANVTNPHSSTPEATALRLVLRDANGRAKFGAGSDGGDAVIMSQLLDHAGLANPHGSTPEATALRLVLRDVNGRAKFGAGSDNDDAVIMSQLLEHAGLANPHGSTSEATALRLVFRDANGRAAFAAGAAADDAATMSQIAALTNATPLATPSVLAMRDLVGKASFVGGTSGNEAVVFSQFAGSYGYNAFVGWFALPNGVVVQWGGGSTGAEETWATRSFPHAFPNQGLIIIGSANEAVTTLDPVIAFRAISATQYEVYNAGYPNRGVSWIAIGR